MISAEDTNDTVQREAHHNMEERLAETPLGVGDNLLHYITQKDISNTWRAFQRCRVRLPEHLKPKKSSRLVEEERSDWHSKAKVMIVLTRQLKPFVYIVKKYRIFMILAWS